MPRGKRVIEAEDRNVEILYTNYAIAQAEEDMGIPIVQFLQSVESNSFSVGDVAKLLKAGMESARMDARLGGRRVTLRDAFAVMDEVGLGQVMEQLLLAVTEVLAKGTSYEEEPDDPNV
jgi:hypothetical protein